MSQTGQLQWSLQWPKVNGRCWQSDYMMTKLGKLLFVFGPVSGKGSFLVRSRFCVQHKGYVDKRKKKKIYWLMGKSFAENNVKRILCFNWTTQWFNVSLLLIPSSFVSFCNDCMPLFRGFSVFVKIGKTLWLCLVSVNILLFILKNTPVNK